jgi:hypothetical protein
LPVLCTVVAFASAAHADVRQKPKEPVRASVRLQAPANIELLNPVALISEVIAALVPTTVRATDTQTILLESNDRDSMSLVTRSAALAQTQKIRVQFAANNEHDKVSLLLAQSQVRVRLAHDLQLRCEVSSQDEMNVDPEIKLDIGVLFKFE